MATFSSKYPFLCVLKYIPSRYCSLKGWQIVNRKAVLYFKKGKLSQNHMENIINKVRAITKDDDTRWVITFVPASTDEKTLLRFSTLAQELQRQQPCPVLLESIHNHEDYVPIHIGGSKKFKVHRIVFEDFKDKNVVLIDDVITSGRSFREMGNQLMRTGAISVYGVIFAMTIHPALPIKTRNHYFYAKKKLFYKRRGCTE